MSKTSEKAVERHLTKEVERVGGWCIKLLTAYINGLPDRLCLFPGGVAAFVETKSRGDKARKLQLKWINKLRGLGFKAEVIDTIEGIDDFINQMVIENEK